MKISKAFTFEASHQLPQHPGKCKRLHGHSWVLTVSVHGRINPDTGMVMDFTDLKREVQPLILALDHEHLGNGYAMVSRGDGLLERKHLPSTVPGLTLQNPTSEELLWWIADHLPHSLPWSHLHLKETCTSEAELTYQEWLRERRKYYAPHEGSQEAPSTETAAGSQEAQGLGKETEALIITDEDIPL